MKKLERILETAIYADDLEACESFYSDVLGLEIYGKQVGRHVMFKLSEQMLLIFNPESTLDERGTAPVPHGSRGPGHFAFAVAEAEMDFWRQRLIEHNVEIEKEIEWPGGGLSIYFRDPAGNSLELATKSIWNL